MNYLTMQKAKTRSSLRKMFVFCNINHWAAHQCSRNMVADKLPFPTLYVIEVPCNGTYIDMELLFKEIFITHLV